MEIGLYTFGDDPPGASNGRAAVEGHITDDSKAAADTFYPAYAEVMTRIGGRGRRR